MAVYFNVSPPSMMPITVSYQTVAGTATANSDYQSVTGSTTIYPGQMFASVGVNTLPDNIVESPETFSVTITSVTGATVGTASATITINDYVSGSGGSGGPGAPAGVVSIAALTDHYPEGTPANFRITLSPPQPTSVSVMYQTIAGTAIENTDYTAKSGTVTIPANQSSVDVNVTTLHDFSEEQGETFSLKITSATGASVSTTQNSALATIDDVPFVLPTITVTGGTIDEGGVFTPTISVDTGTAGNVYTYSINWGDGSQATYGTSDTPSHVYVDNNPTSTPSDDYTITVMAIWPSNGPTATGSATVTVNNIGENVAWSITAPAITEPTDSIGNIPITITLGSSLATSVSFNYITYASTAIADQDYFAANGTVIFAAGETQKTINVGIQGDWITEPSETFIFTATPSGSNPPDVLLTPSSSQSIACVILDNGNWLGVPFRVSDGSQWESDEEHITPGRVPFVVELDDIAAHDIEFSYFTSSGEAGISQDFDGAIGSLIIPAGQLQGTIWIDLVDDSIPEADETFTVFVSELGTPLPAISATGTIFDDDFGEFGPRTGSVMILGAPQVQEPSSSSASEATFAHFLIAYTNPSGLPASVEWYTDSPNSGDATPGFDYVAASGTATLLPTTESSFVLDVAIQIKFDTNYPEPDELFSVKLRNPSGITISADGAEARGTIKDRGDTTLLATEYTIYAVIPEADEVGRRPAGFTVMRTGPIDQPDTVRFDKSGTAGYGYDYYLADMNGVAFAGGMTDRVTIPAGSSAVSFLAVPIPDAVSPEPDETVVLTIATGQPRGNPETATALIKDAGPRVTIVNNSRQHKTPEDDARRESFTISRWGATSDAQVVNLSLSGTATIGDDYYVTSPWPQIGRGAAPSRRYFPSSITLPAGASSVEITIQIIDDWFVESPNETVVVTLANGSGYTIDSQQNTATLTIVDDDVTPVVSITPAYTTVNEWGGASTDLTLSRTGSTEFALPVALGIAGNATKEVDYRLFKVQGNNEVRISAHRTSFEPGEGTITLRLRPIDDNFIEPVGISTENGEDADISVLASSRYTVNCCGNTKIRIVDNERPGAGWEIVRALPQRDPIYTDWEWKNIGGGRSGSWGWERHKLVAEWQDIASFTVPVSAVERPVTVGGNVSTTHARTWNIGGSLSAAVGGQQSWLNIGGTVSGALEHQWSVDWGVGATEDITVPALANVTVTASVLRLSNIVQRSRTGGSSPPPAGAVGENAVTEETGGRFWYTEYLVDWTKDFVFVEGAYWVKMNRN